MTPSRGRGVTSIGSDHLDTARGRGQLNGFARHDPGRKERDSSGLPPDSGGRDRPPADIRTPSGHTGKSCSFASASVGAPARRRAARPAFKGHTMKLLCRRILHLVAGAAAAGCVVRRLAANLSDPAGAQNRRPCREQTGGWELGVTDAS